MAATDAAAALQATGAAALQAITAAALLLPGLASAVALAQGDDSLALQAAQQREDARPGDGRSPAARGLRVDTQTLRLVHTLEGGGSALQITASQDTWSGATPVATAPAAAGLNRPVQRGGVGALVTVGASPLLNGRVALDAQGQPLTRDAGGRWVAAPEPVHTLSTASPETRRQLDARWVRRLADGHVALGAGASDERDHHTRFVHLSRRLDDGAQTFTLALDAGRARMDAVLDHDAAPYLTRTAQAAQIDAAGGQLVWRGRRDDLGLSLGWSRALDAATLAEISLSATQARGDLSNPYRATTVIFAPPAAGADGVRDGDLRALLEQRPRERRQWSLGARLVRHHAGSDGALHLGAQAFGDSWGQRGTRLQAQWLQPVADRGLLSLGLRHHSQGAARFFTPWLVSPQAYRQVTVTPDGQVQVRSYDPALLPAHFSSDPRLAAFGSLTASAGWTQVLGAGVELDLSLDRLWQSGRLKWGGNGEGRYADLRAWTAQATLTFAFDGPAPAPHDAGHGHHGSGHDPVPAEWMALAHAAPAPGRWMLGLHERAATQGGTLRRGTQALDDATLAASGCGGGPCQLAPTAMAMRMQMLDLTLGLAPRWSLMAMVQWMSMRMDTRLLPGAVAGDTPLHLGRHESSAVGDTQLHLLRHGEAGSAMTWVLGLGLSAPTGRTSLTQRRMHQQDGAPLDPGMQTGSGSWEALPSATLRGGRAAWSWGLQASAATRLQAANTQGYAWGLRWQAGGWAGWRATPALSATARLGWRIDHGPGGRAGDAGAVASPSDDAANLGGRFTEAGVGLHHTSDRGALALERVQPLHTQLRGVQLPPRGRWALAWHHAF
ncbi:MAG: DUF3570 domain-containing protein [Rubrivivax sp.]